MAYRDEKGKSYSADYLKTIYAQLTAIFNHAVNFYNLPYNPARRASTMGNEVPKEMDFWMKEEYLKFSESMMDKLRSHYAFEMLYWCGIRSGELLALTLADFDFQKQTVTKSYLNYEMERGAKQAGVKKIRVHDIRNSAVSLLINMGFSVLAIAWDMKRLDIKPGQRRIILHVAGNHNHIRRAERRR